ncbi:no significant blast hit [Histoplasma capsulatum G186AR]|uniref:Uncharacterized protein n=1 Tax=Ajellomyces capsulatus TaxID=5037 RepID=A0A8H7Z9S6_AJECA|nr:hypothetical protein I7I52_02753 [Histoplasma capsulatum]QSS70020.1 no significant blast hit [Histoplasma capsulatum G186AR]
MLTWERDTLRVNPRRSASIATMNAEPARSIPQRTAEAEPSEISTIPGSSESRVNNASEHIGRYVPGQHLKLDINQYLFKCLP